VEILKPIMQKNEV